MEFPMEEEGTYSFNDFVLPSPSPLGDEEEQISRPSSSKDSVGYQQDNGYERMTPKPPAYHSDPTNHQIDHVKRPLSKGTRSHLLSPERSKVSCSRPQTGSDNASDTSQEIQPSQPPKMSNSRIFDSQNPSLSHIRVEHVNGGIDILNEPKLVNGGPFQSSKRNSCSLDPTKKGIWSKSENKETCPISPNDRNFSENSKMEVLSKLTDEILVHNCLSNTENFDLKSSSTTSMDSFSERRVNGKEFGFQQDPTPSTINISMHVVPKKSRISSAIYRNVVQQKPYRSRVEIGSPITEDEDEYACEINTSNDFYTCNNARGTVNPRVWKSSDDPGDLQLKECFESDEDATPDNSYHVAPNIENRYKTAESNENFGQTLDVGEAKLAMRHHEDSKNGRCRVNICEELQIPMVEEIKSGEQKQANTKETNISCVPVVKNHEGKKYGQKSKKENETKRETETAAVKSLAVRKAYDEQQRTELKRRSGKRSKATLKMEDIKDRKTSPEMITETNMKKVKKQSAEDKGRLVTYSDARKTLYVRMESEASDLCSEKDQTRNVEHQKENFSYEYEDDFESDNEIKSSMSDAKQASIPNVTIPSSSNTTNQKRGHVVGKKKSHVEKSHRIKVPPGPKELVLSKENSFALPKIVDVESTEPLRKQPRNAIDTTPHAQRTKELCLPPIEINNFVITKIPMRTSSKDKNYTIEAQNMLAKEKSFETFNRRSEYQDQSAHSGMDCSRRKSSIRRKSSARYDRDILENRARAPPFDTRRDEEVKVKLPKL